MVSGRKHKDYVQSAAASIQNMLLMAYAKGVGACWICDLPKQSVMRSIFNIPKNYDVIAYVALGYPLIGKESTKEQKEYHYGTEKEYDLHERRYSYQQVVCREKFMRVEGDSTYMQLRKENLKEKVWKCLPSSIKKIWNRTRKS